MRVLMVSDLYPPVIGGLEQHVRNLSRELVGRGHEVSVVTQWHDGSSATEVDGGVKVHRIRSTMSRASGAFADSARRYAPPFPDPEVVRGLRAVLARERPQVVHAHNWLVHSFLPLKRPRGPKLVLSLHDYSLVCAKKSLLYRGAPCSGPGFRKCLSCASDHYGTAKGLPITLGNWAMTAVEQRAVDMFVPVSGAVAQGNELVERRLPFEVIPNFVPDDIAQRQDPAAPELAQLPAEPFLLFVGALGRHKGIHVLLDAYQRLAQPPPLVLMGATWPDTPDRFPDGTVVLRDWRHASVMAAWHRSMLALIPSIYPDACPTVAMEAMASGKPVVASALGGLPDLVDDEQTGLLVRPGDGPALARAIERLVLDPKLRKEMGEAGRRKVEDFSASTVVARIERLYEGLCARVH